VNLSFFENSMWLGGERVNTSPLKLGANIRLLRESRGLSREEFCEDEAHITVRQLARIEAGESFPTFLTFTYICDRLHVPLSFLAGVERSGICEHFIRLKHILLKKPTYDDPIRIAEHQQMLDEIDREYYGELPEEEKFFTDIIKTINEVHYHQNLKLGKAFLQPYLTEIKTPKHYHIHEWFIIRLYFYCYLCEPFETESFEVILKAVIAQAQIVVGFEGAIFHRLIIKAMEIFEKNKHYHRLPELIEVSRKLMKRCDDFHKQPVVDMFEGKYWLFEKQDSEKAYPCYAKGAKFAELFDDAFLSTKILQEWESDSKKFAI